MTSQNRSDAWKVFEMLALLGPATFLEPLIPPEKAGTEYLHFNERNSRNFLLLRILSEVQKSGIALGRWRKFAAGADLDRPRGELGNYDIQTLESYIDEQSLWQRKLSEGLVLLINFSTTNELPHYYHFLLIQQLERQERRIRELRDFFAVPRDAAERKRDQIHKRLESVEKSIDDLSKCWYLDQKRQRRSASFSQQLRHALCHATLRERRALGYTYAKGFGEASSNIHFSGLKPEYLRPYDRFSLGFAFCGLLTVGILDRAHKLVGASPQGINQGLAEAMAREPHSDTTSETAEVGDFVLVEGPSLGVVEQKVASEYGYEAYLVRYVEKEDEGPEWFPAFDVVRLSGKQELSKALETTLADFRAQGLPAIEPPPTDEEVTEAIEQAMLVIWQKGLRDYVERTAKPKVIEPQDENTTT